MDAGLREVDGVAYVLMVNPVDDAVGRLQIKLRLDRVQWVLLLAHETQRTTTAWLDPDLGRSGARWNFSLHVSRR